MRQREDICIRIYTAGFLLRPWQLTLEEWIKLRLNSLWRDQVTLWNFGQGLADFGSKVLGFLVTNFEHFSSFFFISFDFEERFCLNFNCCLQEPKPLLKFGEDLKEKLIFWHDGRTIIQCRLYPMILNSWVLNETHVMTSAKVENRFYLDFFQKVELHPDSLWDLVLPYRRIGKRAGASVLRASVREPRLICVWYEPCWLPVFFNLFPLGQLFWAFIIG